MPLRFRNYRLPTGKLLTVPLKQVPLEAFADLLGYLLLLGQLFLGNLDALERAGVLLGELLATW